MFVSAKVIYLANRYKISRACAVCTEDGMKEKRGNTHYCLPHKLLQGLIFTNVEYLFCGTVKNVSYSLNDLQSHDCFPCSRNTKDTLVLGFVQVLGEQLILLGSEKVEKLTAKMVT